MWSPFGYDRWGYNYYGWNTMVGMDITIITGVGDNK